MSEPMEDKRLERGVEEIAREIVDCAEECPHDNMHGVEQMHHNELWLNEDCLTDRIAEALQAERDKLNIEVDRQTEKLCYENATLQSQITALKERLKNKEKFVPPSKPYTREDGIHIPEGWHEMGG